MSQTKESLGNENRIFSFLLLVCLIALVALNIVLGTKIVSVQQSIKSMELKMENLATGKSQLENPNNKGIPYSGKLNVSTAYIEGGDDNPEILIVAFLDYECPFCAQANKIVGEILNSNPGKVVLVRFDYPLPFHEKAFDASLFAYCASAQDFVDINKVSAFLFESQSNLEREILLSSAEHLNINGDKVSRCMDSQEASDRLNQSIKIGEGIGIKGTPAFIISKTFELTKSLIELEGELIYLSQLPVRIRELLGN